MQPCIWILAGRRTITPRNERWTTTLAVTESTHQVPLRAELKPSTPSWFNCLSLLGAALHFVRCRLVADYSSLGFSMGKKQSKKLDPEVLGDLLKHTNFDEKELKSWYKGFLKDCPSGYLTKQQFIEMYKKVFDKGDASRLAACVFRRFDVNGDGKIGKAGEFWYFKVIFD